MSLPKTIQFAPFVEKRLHNVVEQHNAATVHAGRKATVPMLKAVYRRGAKEVPSTVHGIRERDKQAMMRVHAFTHLLANGSPANPNYKQDNDLLPKSHPRSTKGEAAMLLNDLLQVVLQNSSEYASSERAIFALAEYSPMSYDILPALRGAWLRGVRSGDDPFERARDLAINLYDSQDADLLPRKKRAGVTK